MLVCCNNICGTVLKWYEVQARYYDVPLFILDTPFCHTEFSAEAQQYVRGSSMSTSFSWKRLAANV
jgi:benzoyl-CoA reductase/2-hydroxyglutaryl-CoA dehydratase subunit BcrC/BadD/HgdB